MAEDRYDQLAMWVERVLPTLARQVVGAMLFVAILVGVPLLLLKVLS